MTKIPYKINLSEDELPKYWQNIRPYMQEAPDPFINPVTFKPCTADDPVSYTHLTLPTTSRV